MKLQNFNWYTITAITLTVIGLLIMVGFLVRLNADYTFAGEKLLLPETAQVGDFIGGLERG